MEKAFEVLAQMETFDPTLAMKYANENWQIPITLTSAYLALCFFGPSMIVKPFNLKLPLALWNLGLSVFSFLGFIFTFPALLTLLQSGFKNSICLDPKLGWAKGTTGFWVCLFIYSKVPELVDTVFIILRKKPLIFLHWYHHATVLLYCWHSYANNVGIGLYFVAMNYGVHAVMYFYYFMQAVGICPKNFPAYLITVGQILQMVVGTFVCGMSWYYYYSNQPCHNEYNNMVLGGLMYCSYLCLFVQFALKRFVFKKNKTN